MNDLMTPVLPAAHGNVGTNCDGSPTAVFGAMSWMTPRASFLPVFPTLRRRFPPLLPCRRSTPLVALLAAQFAAQLPMTDY